MKKKIDLAKKYGTAVKALAAECGFLGSFKTSTLRYFLKVLSEKQHKTKEDEDVIEVIKTMIKYRSDRGMRIEEKLEGKK